MTVMDKERYREGLDRLEAERQAVSKKLDDHRQNTVTAAISGPWLIIVKGQTFMHVPAEDAEALGLLILKLARKPAA